MREYYRLGAIARWQQRLLLCSGPEIKQALDETVKEMGLSSLKSKHTGSIFAVVAGKYRSKLTFVSFPTGYGKSAQQHLSLMTATPWPGLSFYHR